jgi:hypothetical protein
MRWKVVESFWVVPDVATLRTPLSILREQATALTKQTNGLLVGQVDVNQQSDGDLQIKLEVIVPALNEYRVRILRYLQPITLYPGSLTGMGIGAFVEVNSEEDFVSGVRNALSSQAVKNILSSLMSQVGDTSLTR